MKKLTFLCAMAAGAMMLTSCGSTNNTWGQIGQQVLNDVLVGATGSAATEVATDAIGNILGSVINGSTKPTKQQLIGSWTYSQPGCAFTSDKLLAQAGGEVVASQIKSKLDPTYQKIGIKSGNTKISFAENGTFSSTFAGKSFSGNYTYDEATAKITLQGMLLNINCYAKRNSNGLAILFESSKLLTLLQTMSALSGNSSLQTVGEISKSYDGLRLGFDFK